MMKTHWLVLVCVLLAGCTRSPRASLELSDPMVLKQFRQLDNINGLDIDALQAVSGNANKKGCVELKNGIGQVSAIYRERTVPMKTGAEWTVSIDFLKGPMTGDDKAPGLGFTSSDSGRLAGGHSKLQAGYLIRLRAIGGEKGRFEFLNAFDVINGSPFAVGPTFAFPVGNTNWYRETATFKVIDRKKGQIKVKATLLDLGADGKGDGKKVAEYEGEFLNPAVCANSRIYTGFRMDATSTPTSVNHFSLAFLDIP